MALYNAHSTPGILGVNIIHKCPTESSGILSEYINATLIPASTGVNILTTTA